MTFSVASFFLKSRPAASFFLEFKINSFDCCCLLWKVVFVRRDLFFVQLFMTCTAFAFKRFLINSGEDWISNEMIVQIAHNSHISKVSLKICELLACSSITSKFRSLPHLIKCLFICHQARQFSSIFFFVARENRAYLQPIFFVSQANLKSPSDLQFSSAAPKLFQSPYFLTENVQKQMKLMN